MMAGGMMAGGIMGPLCDIAGHLARSVDKELITRTARVSYPGVVRPLPAFDVQAGGERSKTGHDMQTIGCANGPRAEFLPLTSATSRYRTALAARQ
jgi:hypothetical protein